MAGCEGRLPSLEEMEQLEVVPASSSAGRFTRLRGAGHDLKPANVAPRSADFALPPSYSPGDLNT